MKNKPLLGPNCESEVAAKIAFMRDWFAKTYTKIDKECVKSAQDL